MTWKYAFFIKPYSSCNSRIYLFQCFKGFWGYIRKKCGKSEERGREKDKCHTIREGPTSLKNDNNLEMNNGHMSEGE
jgi:hypothetical protein